ncbi:hypothetical protein MPER_06363, partial [Moniliophthora perniciosa FA553]
MVNPPSRSTSPGAIYVPNNPNPSSSSSPQTPTPASSLHSILASTHKDPHTNGAASTSSKRKLDNPDNDDDSQAKVRRVVRDHVTHDPSRVVPMTTVICLHAAVAQKSYGSEKRFLCPPPVVHIEGPVWHMRNQQL